MATAFLSVREFGEYTGLSVSTIRRAIKAGKLPVVKLGPRSTRIPLDQAVEALTSAASEVK